MLPVCPGFRIVSLTRVFRRTNNAEPPRNLSGCVKCLCLFELKRFFRSGHRWRMFFLT